MKSHLCFFSFIACLLMSYPKIIVKSNAVQVCPMLSSKNFIVLGLTFRSLIFSKFLHVVLSKDPTSFFAYGYLIFSELFVEKTVLSPWSGLGILVQNHLTIYVKYYFWALSSIPFIHVCLYASIVLFDYILCFVVIPEIRKYESSNLVFFKIVLAI